MENYKQIQDYFKNGVYNKQTTLISNSNDIFRGYGKSTALSYLAYEYGIPVLYKYAKPFAYNDKGLDIKKFSSIRELRGRKMDILIVDGLELSDVMAIIYNFPGVVLIGTYN